MSDYHCAWRQGDCGRLKQFANDFQKHLDKVVADFRRQIVELKVENVYNIKQQKVKDFELFQGFFNDMIEMSRDTKRVNEADFFARIEKLQKDILGDVHEKS